jgi:hypothetical protein
MIIEFELFLTQSDPQAHMYPGGVTYTHQPPHLAGLHGNLDLGPSPPYLTIFSLMPVASVQPCLTTQW